MIRELRKQKGITQSKLAQECGVTQAYISMIERNGNLKPSISTLYKLSVALEVPLMELIKTYLGGKDENHIA